MSPGSGPEEWSDGSAHPGDVPPSEASRPDDGPADFDDGPPPRDDEEEPFWLDEECPLDPEGDDREWLDWEQVTAQAQDEEDDQARAREFGLEDAYLHTRGTPTIPGVKSGPGGGFGQGEVLDQAPPGLVLAGHADYASGPDRTFTGVSDDELAGLLYARRRLLARESWERLMALAECIRRRPAPGVDVDKATGMPAVWDEGTAGEVHLQLAITRRAADHLLGLAWDLVVKLPATSAMLRDGMIDEDKASTIASYCANLTPAEARQAEDILYASGDIETMTWGMIRDRIARAVMEVNPDAARKRREDAARERRVEIRAEVSGNAMIAGRELPPAAVLAMDQELTARARVLRKLGVPGGMDELRVQAFLERWGLADPERERTRHAPPAPAGHRRRQDGADRDGNGGDYDGDGDGDGGGNGGRGPHPRGPYPAGPFGGGCACGGTGAVTRITEGGLVGQIHLTVPVATLTEMAGRPGSLRGTGPIDPDLTRDLAGKAAQHPRTSYHLTITDKDGRPVAHACGKPGPGDPAGRRTRGKPDIPDPPDRSGRDGMRDTWPPSRRGRARLEVIDRGPPGSHGTWRYTQGDRVIIFEFEDLTGPCDHRYRAAGHDPGRLLRHLTGVLNQTCTNPACRRPEGQSDYEHARPWEQGGISCPCNAGPVCRRHHRDKQRPGWKVEGTGTPGYFTWTTPSGRKYLSKPTMYPI